VTPDYYTLAKLHRAIVWDSIFLFWGPIVVLKAIVITSADTREPSPRGALSECELRIGGNRKPISLQMIGSATGLFCGSENVYAENRQPTTLAKPNKPMLDRITGPSLAINSEELTRGSRVIAMAWPDSAYSPHSSPKMIRNDLAVRSFRGAARSASV
jgi:hypothetical protein